MCEPPPIIDLPSPNFDERPRGARIDALVIHSGEGTRASDLHELRTPGTKKSAHYYVDRGGHVYQLVDVAKRAWAVGVSSYLGRTQWNDFSVSIECEHRRGQDWPPLQKMALTALAAWLVQTRAIPLDYIVPHRAVASPAGRKSDPTDWPDDDFRAWARSLAPDPLRTHLIAGPPSTRAYFCGSGFFDFYALRGGLDLFGYALGDETRDGDVTYMRLERVILKYMAGVGVHLALLGEARARGWLP